MNNRTRSIIFLCVLVSTTPIHGMHKEARPATQQEKYLQYKKIITPLIVEAARANSKRSLDAENINDIVTYAVLRDTLRMFNKRTTVPSTTYGAISLSPISLDEIARLIKLCDFLKAGTLYKINATRIEIILRSYCTHPASRRVQEARLAKLIKPLISETKTDSEPKRKDQ